MLRSVSAFALFLAAAPAWAQPSLGGGSESKPAGDRPESARVGPMEFLEGAGEAFVGLFRRSERHGPDNPQWNSIAGPRDAVMTFAEATEHVAMGHEREGMLRATLLIPPDVGPWHPDYLKDLGEVFDRLPELSPASIPSETQADDQQLLRWELFPRGVERDWAYAALDGAPAGAIVLKKYPDGWKFTPETIAGAADLAKSMRAIPPRSRLETRGAAFSQVVVPTLTDSPWWAWLTTLLGLAAGIAAAWGVTRLLRGAAGKLSEDDSRLEKLGGNVLGPVLKGLAVPCGLLFVVLGLLAGSAPLELTPTLENLRWTLAEALLVIAGVWAAVSLIELAVLGVRRLAFDSDDPYVRMSTSVLRRAVRLVAGVVLALFVVQNLFSLNLTALLGGFALLALALSLAAKDAVANLFGGAMIFGTRPFLVGDWIGFDGRIGEVADVSLQATRVRLLTGEMWSVPNSNFVDKPVKNLSLRKYLRRVFDVRLPLDTPPEKIAEAEEILKDVLTGDAAVGDGQGDLEEHPPKVNFEAIGEYFFNVRADYWYLMHPEEKSPQRETERGWFSYLAHCDAVNTAVLERFRDAGIKFALPATVVHEADGDAGKLAGAAE